MTTGGDATRLRTGLGATVAAPLFELEEPFVEVRDVLVALGKGLLELVDLPVLLCDGLRQEPRLVLHAFQCTGI